MKKYIAALLAALVSVGICSCSPAKKPEAQDRTFIVPEVSSVPFDTIELESAPKAVRDIARTMEGRDATTWAQSGGSAYLLASQAEKTGKYDLKFEKVLQRIPDQNFTWLDVSLAYSKRKNAASSDKTVFTVVRADFKNPPNGVGFSLSGLETDGTTAARPQARPAAPQVQITQPGASVEQPLPNQEITSPVKIRGTVKDQGQARVRISTRGGQIIREENITPAPGTGSFSLDMTYSPPEMPTPGEISIISVSGADEKVLARVPVMIK